MSDTKRKISAWIPAALYDEVEKAGYTSPTIAVTKALEMLVRAQSGDNQDTIGDNPETNWRQLETENKNLKNEIEKIQGSHNQDITGYKENIKVLNIEIARLKEVLSNAPDPVELAKAQERIEGLQMVLEERNKRIEEINSHYENISSFANYFKSNEPKMLNPPAAEKSKAWWKFW